MSENELTFKSLFIPFTTKKAIIFIVIIGFIAFANCLFNNFVWDDVAFILNNPDVHTISLSKIFGLSFFNKDGFYRSIPAAYYSLLYLFFKENVFFYHLPQVLLHIVNSILIFKIFMKFMNKKLSFILTLIFLVHPINTESVAYIGAASGTIYSFFGLSSVALVLNNKLSKKTCFFVTLLLLCSALTKEEALLYYVLVLLTSFLFQKKWLKNLFVYEVFSVLIYLLIRVTYGKVYFLGLGSNLLSKNDVVTNGRFIPIMHLGIIERFFNLPAVIFYYLKTFFYPLRLAVDQLWIVTTLSFEKFYLPLILDLSFIAILILIAGKLFAVNKRSFKLYLFFFCWFALGLLIHSQVVPLDMTVADRWFYPSIIGLLGMIGVVLERLPDKWEIGKLIIPVTIIILIFLSLITVKRNSDFTNEISLYTHDSQIEDNYELEINLGTAYYSLGDSKNAIVHYQKSVNLMPYEGNYVSLANAYAKEGKISLAKTYFLKAYNSQSFMRQKHIYLTYSGLAWVYVLENNPRQARKLALEGLKEYPYVGDLWLPLAVSEYKLGNQNEALTAVKKAKQLLTNGKADYIYTQILNKQPVDIR